MVKGLFVVMDGVADEPCRILGEITPLQSAQTPNLNYLAKRSEIFRCYTVKEGIVPESSSAVISLLGYDPRIVSRGVLEALGAGMKISRGDLALRCNFATVDDLESGRILDRRAGRTLSTKEASILADEINRKVNLPFRFEFKATNQHRAVLVFRGGFSDNISGLDSAYRDGAGNGDFSNQVAFSKSLDDEEDSKLSADLINVFIRKSHELLDKHPLNFRRVRKGLFSANFLLCRDAGSEVPRLKKLKGKWMALGYMPLEKGIARLAKMDLYNFYYPKMKGIDVYANLYTGLKKAVRKAIKMIKKHAGSYDYFYIHFKETDVPGHDNKPHEKVKMIEVLDKRFFSFLKGFVEKNKIKLVVTADHATSCKRKAHTGDSVPVLFYNPANRSRERWHRFIEDEGFKGKKILARKLLEKTLFFG